LAAWLFLLRDKKFPAANITKEKESTMKKMTCSLFSFVIFVLVLVAPSSVLAVGESVQWLNHLGFLPGNASVGTAFNAVDSGVGGGLSGLIVSSTTTGEVDKYIEQGVQVPPGFLVSGVRVCYESTSATSFISQIRLAQLQDPPATALVLLDDGADLVNPGPVCVNSALPFAGSIDPALGALRLSLGVNFADIIVSSSGASAW
jgi:hypothetical protein